MRKQRQEKSVQKPLWKALAGGFVLLALRPGGGRMRPRAPLHRDTGLCHLPAEEPRGCLQAATGRVSHPAPGKGAKNTLQGTRV